MPFPAAVDCRQAPRRFKVIDAQGQSLAYVYARESEAAAGIAGALTEDEARRIASNIAKLPALLGAAGERGFRKEAGSACALIN